MASGTTTDRTDDDPGNDGAAHDGAADDGAGPTAGATAPKDTTGRRALALFAPYKGRLTLIALAILVTSALGVVNPFLTQAVFDKALFVAGGPDIGLLAALVGAMIGIAVVSAVIGIGQTYLTTVLGNRVMQSLRDRLFAHLQRMQLGFFTSTRTGSTSPGWTTTWAASSPSSPTPRRRSSATSSPWWRR